MRIHWLIILLLLLQSEVIFAQQTGFQRFNEINMQPEVWSFQTPPEGQVDSKGDLHLSIPVLTVPGSPGRDFPIQFSYKAGIRYHQTASWLGLGWNFDPGSITRDVLGNIVADGQHYGVDRVNEPSTSEQLPDQFFINIPGRGTASMRRTNLNGFNEDTNQKSFRAPYNESGFYLEQHQPWKIEIVVSERDDHPWPGNGIHTLEQGDYITRFVITTEDNVRYIYGNPTVAAFTAVTQQAAVSYYPNTWRLLGIAGPEYRGSITELVQAPGHIALDRATLYNHMEHYVDWVRFDYGFDEQQVVGVTSAGPGRAIQNSYLKFISTPSHRAEFISQADRQDADLVYHQNNTMDISPWYKRLTGIRLTDREGVISKIVTLDHGQGVDGYSLGKGLAGGLDRGKLTLHGFYYENSGGETLPGFDFKYPAVGSSGNPEWSYFPDDHYYDGLGYYNDKSHPGAGIDSNPDDAKAWSLTEVIFPGGGWEKYTYTNDQIDQTHSVIDRVRYNLSTHQYQHDEVLFYYDSWPNGGSSRRQGGIRVESIERSNGFGEAELTEFYYGEGSVGCMPQKLLPFVNSHYIAPNMFSPINRGEQDVVYSWVKRVLPDSSFSINYYKSTSTCRTLLFQSPVYPQRWLAFSASTERPRAPLRGGIIESTALRGSENLSVNYVYESASQQGARILELPGILSHKYKSHRLSGHLTREDHLQWFQSDRKRYKSLIREYVETTGQLRREKTESAEWTVDKHIRYAWEVPEYGGDSWQPTQLYGIREQHALSYIAEQTTFSRNKRRGDTGLNGSFRQTFRNTNSSSDKRSISTWRLYERYDLNVPHDLAYPPPFTAWEPDEQPSEQWQLSFRNLEYANGNVVRIRDGRGGILSLFYGDNDHNFSNAEHFMRFGHSQLTGISVNEQLTRAFDYTEGAFNVAVSRDENGNDYTYSYDSLGRLKHVRDPAGNRVEEYSYSHGRTSGEYAAEHNRVSSKTFQNAAKYRQQHTFVDGLGNAQQVLIEADNKTTSLTNTTDVYGRIKQKFLPYIFPEGTPTCFDSLFPYRLGTGDVAQEATDRVTSYAYAHSSSQAAERIDYPPVAVGGETTAQLFKTRFESAKQLFPEFYPPSSAVLLKANYMRDERGRETVRYYDDMEHLVGTRSFSGTTNTAHNVDASCYPNSGCPTEGGWDVTSFSLDQSTQVKWDCSLETSGDYRTGEFSIVRSTASADTILKITSHGQHSGRLRLEPGDYRLIAGAVRLNPNHNLPARVWGTIDFWNPGLLDTHLQTFTDVNVEGQKLAIYPPNFFEPPGESTPQDWVSRHTYNTLNLVTSDLPVDAGEVRYLYDAHGNLRFMQDANMRQAGVIRFYAYDFLDRLSYIGHATAAFDTLHTGQNYGFEQASTNLMLLNIYDAPPEIANLPFNGYPVSEYQDFDFSNERGKRTAHAYRSFDGWRIKLMGYDKTGNLIRKRLLSPDLDPVDYHLTYDWQGNPVELSLQVGHRGFRHKFEYDSRDRITQSFSSENNSAFKQHAGYGYTPEGMRQYMSLGMGSNGDTLIYVPYAYNLRGWITESGSESNDPFAIWQRLTHLPDGQLVNKEFRDYAGNAKRFSYSYDDADRLKKVAFAYLDDGWQTTGSYRLHNLDYDANGNLLTLNRQGRHGEIIDELSYRYGANNRLLELDDLSEFSEEKWDAESAILSYDSNGNVIRIVNENDGVTDIQYDWFNRPVSVKTPDRNVTKTAYDQQSRLVSKNQNGGNYSFLYTESAEIGHFQNRSLIRWNLLGDGVIGYWIPGRTDSKTGKTIRAKKYYYLSNRQGSIRRIVDDKGELVSADEYYPFGSNLPGLSYKSGAEHYSPGYSGKLIDTGLGWLHFGRRQYNPSLSRWLTPDPKAGDYLAFSPYAFTANNPVSNVEKDGAYFDTVMDLVSLGYSLSELVSDPADYKNWTAVALDVVGIATPGAAGLGLAYKTANKARDAQSAIDKAGDLVKGFCSGKKAVFRGDRRMPAEIFEKGFTTRGESMDLLKHSRNNMKPPSNYVSTSKQPGVAGKFAQEGNYVYVIRPQKGVDVNKTLGSKSPYPYEKEIAIPDGVKPEDIIGARKIGKDGKFTGEFIKNPNYKE